MQPGVEVGYHQELLSEHSDPDKRLFHSSLYQCCCGILLNQAKADGVEQAFKNSIKLWLKFKSAAIWPFLSHTSTFDLMGKAEKEAALKSASYIP